MRARSKKKEEKKAGSRIIVGLNQWKGSNVQGWDRRYHRTNRVAVSNDALTRSYRIPTLRSFDYIALISCTHTVRPPPRKRNSIYIFSPCLASLRHPCKLVRKYSRSGEQIWRSNVLVVIYFVEGYFLFTLLRHFLLLIVHAVPEFCRVPRITLIIIISALQTDESKISSATSVYSRNK